MENQENNSINVSADVDIVKIPVDKIHPNDYNPNKLSDAMFNRLVDDMNTIGFLQPILVTPEEDGTYKIIDGEHRYECAKIADMTVVPCVIVSGDFAKDEIKQKFQTMRMNMIRGTIDKKKLANMVSDIVNTMPIEEVAESMAYDDVDALRALIDDARKSLSPEMRKDFDKAKDEVKSVDDLTSLLNKIFTKYGSTLPYNFMYFDFGGKEHIWVRMPEKSLKTFKSFAQASQAHGVTFSSVVMAAMRQVLSDSFYIENKDKLEEVHENGDKANEQEE